MQILNLTQNTTIATKVVIAQTLASRMVGLLKHSSLDDGEALIITQCRSIHMFFMRFAIDVVFVDGHSKVVGLVQNIKPFGISSVYFKAQDAIELPAGTIQRTKTQQGDQLLVS